MERSREGGCGETARGRESTYFVSERCQAVSFPCPRASRLGASATSQPKRCLPQEVEHFTTCFLSLGFPSCGDCKTFPQSLIQKLCRRRQVSCAVTALAAYLPVVPAAPRWNNLFSSLFLFFFFPLKSKHCSCMKHLSKGTPYRPSNNHGVGSAQA